MDRTCQICKKEFQYPSGLRRHAERKTSCARSVDPVPRAVGGDHQQNYPCRYCNRVFAQQSSRSRHETKVCKIKKNAPSAKTVAAGPILTKDDLDAAIAPLLVEIAQLKAGAAQPLAASQAISGATVRGDHNTVVNAQTVVSINIFGRENTAAATVGRIRALIEESRSESAAPLLGQIMSEIYRAPENRNAYLPNKKRPEAMVYIGPEPADNPASWEARDAAALLPAMITKATDRFFEADSELARDPTLPPGFISKKNVLQSDVVHKTDGGLAPTAELQKAMTPIQRALLLNNRPVQAPGP